MQRNGKAPAFTNGAVLSEPLPPPSTTITLLNSDTPAPATLLDTDTPALEAPTTLGADNPAHKLRTSAPATIDGQLLAARVAIDTVLSTPAMLAALALYGYDAERMRAGRALYDAALALDQQQRAGYGQRYATTDARDAAQAQAHAAYMRHMAVARVALRGDRGAAQTLGLANARKLSRAGWLAQAQQFYANALGNSAIIQTLAQFGVAASQLVEAQSLVAAVAAKQVAQQAARADALALTKQRDAALAALKAWMRDFRAIARAALGE